MATRDQIVETRTWRSGVEIVARVNWTHIARVRQALALAGDEYQSGLFEQRVVRYRPKLVVTSTWPHAGPRAA